MFEKNPEKLQDTSSNPANHMVLDGWTWWM